LARRGVHSLNDKKSLGDQESALLASQLRRWHTTHKSNPPLPWGDPKQNSQLPNSIDAIGIKLGIAANDRDRFYLSLGNEQAIKRISVMAGPTGAKLCIIHRDW